MNPGILAPLLAGKEGQCVANLQRYFTRHLCPDASGIKTIAVSAQMAKHVTGNAHRLKIQETCQGSAILRTKPKGPVIETTLNVAVYFPTVKGILLCPEFNAAGNSRSSGCGLGASVRKADDVATFTVSTPSPPDAYETVSSGFFSHVGHETMNQSTTTPIQGTPNHDHTSLSFVKVEFKGPRKQRLTNWFSVPDEAYADGNARGYRVAAEFMSWVQSRPATYETGMIVREVMAAAFAVLAEPCTQGTHCKRGAAVTFLDAMAECVTFVANNTNHQTYLEGKAQHSENWARESALRDAERNRETGRRLAAERKAKREARMAGSEVAQ